MWFFGTQQFGATYCFIRWSYPTNPLLVTMFSQEPSVEKGPAQIDIEKVPNLKTLYVQIAYSKHFCKDSLLLCCSTNQMQKLA